MKNKKVLKSITENERERVNAVRFYLRGVQAKYDARKLLKAISVLHGKSRCIGNNIRAWALQLRDNGTTVASRRGCHGKRPKKLDERSESEVRKWLSSEAKTMVTPKLLQDKLNREILKPLAISISLPTARRYLKETFNWVRSRRSAGMFNDGHDSEEVKAYRSSFLEEIEEIKRRMMRLPGCRPEGLKDGERPLIFYTHDESSFQTNDCGQFVYHPKGERPFYKKGSGGSFMVSEFLSEVDGPIKAVRKIIHSGKANDGYWNGKQMYRQLRRLLAYHKRNHSDCDAVIAIDNARNHTGYAPDALDAYKMNKGMGNEKQKNQYVPKGMWYIQDGVRVDQSYIGENGFTKGITAVLQERGINFEGITRGKCQKCHDQFDTDERACCQARLLSQQPDFMAQPTLLEGVVQDFNEGKDMGSIEEEESEESENEEEEGRVGVKAKQMKKNQRKMKEHREEQKTKERKQKEDQDQDQDWGKEKEEEEEKEKDPKDQNGVQVARLILYPKFHCELNFIEMYWGLVKRVTRSGYHSSPKSLRSALPGALDSVSIETIRRFAGRSFRYMEAYRNDFSGPKAEEEMKKYTSHRRLSERLCRPE
ncbi:MAG: hypothetical protein J3Q66DRAFT_429196 [Benniella sp.]|nr:MAG: hypothetical protein J3Q66DRAFT_429196 [Benniella sp.]